MNQPAISGQGFAKDLRAEGYDVPANIPDNQYLAYKQRIGGGHDYAPTKEPGAVSGGNGTMLTSTEAAQQKSDIAQKRQQALMGTRFGLALQQNGFNLAVQRGQLGDADKIYSKFQEQYLQANVRMRTMDQNYRDALQGNQQAQVSLLMNHIGMTAPVGSRIARATIDEAEESANKIGLKINTWFHQEGDGSWKFDGPKGGINLTKTQMQQMVELAHQKSDQLHEVIGEASTALNPLTSETQAPGVAAVGGPTAMVGGSAGSGKGKKAASRFTNGNIACPIRRSGS